MRTKALAVVLLACLACSFASQQQFLVTNSSCFEDLRNLCPMLTPPFTLESIASRDCFGEHFYKLEASCRDMVYSLMNMSKENPITVTMKQLQNSLLQATKMLLPFPLSDMLPKQEEEPSPAMAASEPPPPPKSHYVVVVRHSRFRHRGPFKISPALAPAPAPAPAPSPDSDPALALTPQPRFKLSKELTKVMVPLPPFLPSINFPAPPLEAVPADAPSTAPVETPAPPPTSSTAEIIPIVDLQPAANLPPYGRYDPKPYTRHGRGRAKIPPDSIHYSADIIVPENRNWIEGSKLYEACHDDRIAFCMDKVSPPYTPNRLFEHDCMLKNIPYLSKPCRKLILHFRKFTPGQKKVVKNPYMRVMNDALKQVGKSLFCVSHVTAQLMKRSWEVMAHMLPYVLASLSLTLFFVGTLFLSILCCCPQRPPAPQNDEEDGALLPVDAPAPTSLQPLYTPINLAHSSSLFHHE